MEERALSLQVAGPQRPGPAGFQARQGARAALWPGLLPGVGGGKRDWVSSGLWGDLANFWARLSPAGLILFPPRPDVLTDLFFTLYSVYFCKSPQPLSGRKQI